ncbi:MAG: DNA-deoxyinosine glycosylase [Tenericutes bacterium]|nr:DNA-deoxyinosine glycosylase [Mycoplasmatota bacterium]
MNKEIVKQDFKAIIDSHSTILILGSIPSVKSREYNFYYMHKQNRFWKVLANIFDNEFLSEDILVKERMLQKYHIALYDVIESCDITGSSDASISDVQAANISKLIEKTKIDTIYLNGLKAYSLFTKYNPNLIHKAIYPPSTSPANARYNMEKLLEKWLIIKK